MSSFVDGIATRLNAIFDPAALGALIANWLANAIIAVAVFAAYYLLWRVLRLILRHPLHDRFDETASAFLETVVKYAVLALGVVSALDAAGIQTSAVLASAGIVGLTLGFAARDALSNLISGILIFLDRPFVIGDLVEIEGVYGRVDRITLRSTRVVTVDGKMLAVPNTEVINKTVASYTNFPHLRLDIDVTVAVTEDVDRARQVLLDLVRGQPAYLATPPPRVVVTALNDYNVALQLQVWIKDERDHIAQRFDLREKVFEALTEAGVDMPYETFGLAPLQVRMEDGEVNGNGQLST